MITVMMMLISIVHFGGQVEGGNISAGNVNKMLSAFFYFGNNSHDEMNYLTSKKINLSLS